ncbi:MAG: LPS export ABC transporter periplasmic protein LptC [Rikenellaceae bacterium]|nr:LPS export ABC transporter periplasmic protein LptC [Rikenellaceae bacterium]
MALLIVGATAYVSSKKSAPEGPDRDARKAMVTQRSENLTIINSVDGKLSYRFETPLLERYELADEPYIEFTKGVKIESYNDSTHIKESELVADHAKYIEPIQLWEARGNVVAKNDKGEVLETQQLFWDQKADRIYSRVDTKIIQRDGETEIIGIGFESDSKLDSINFYQPSGHVMVDASPSDSTSVENSTPAPTPNPGQSPATAPSRQPASNEAAPLSAPIRTPADSRQ